MKAANAEIIAQGEAYKNEANSLAAIELGQEVVINAGEESLINA